MTMFRRCMRGVRVTEPANPVTERDKMIVKEPRICVQPMDCKQPRTSTLTDDWPYHAVLRLHVKPYKRQGRVTCIIQKAA